MKNDVGWFCCCVAAAGIFFIMGFMTGETSGGKQKVVYCVEQPEKCKIEYQYFKLVEQK